MNITIDEANSENNSKQPKKQRYSESAALTVLVEEEWKRFCANCAMLTNVDRESLI